MSAQPTTTAVPLQVQIPAPEPQEAQPTTAELQQVQLPTAGLQQTQPEPQVQYCLLCLPFLT